MAFLSGVHFLTGLHCKLRPITEGNSETNDKDDGAGAMEAIYFGNAHWRGNSGAGPEGPWAGARILPTSAVSSLEA
jgi:hypothetical protein